MIRAIPLLYPKKYREEIKKLLFYCGINTDVNVYLSKIIIFGFVASIVLGFLLSLFIKLNVFIMIIIAFILVQGSLYAWLVLNADSRALFVETLLPDVLQLMSSNLRAGMTIDRALLLSARPEFGRFKDEINRVGKEVATGKEFSESLLDLAKRIKSDRVAKTFRLIVSGVASGGQLSDLLEQTAGNLRQQRLLEQRVKTNVLVYVIFIFSAIGFGAPTLFGLSSFLVKVITEITANIEIPETTGQLQIPITFAHITITPEFVMNYTLISLVTMSILGSLVLGLIAKGKEKEGIKYIPILVTLTVGLFFLVRFVISTILSGLFQL